MWERKQDKPTVAFGIESETETTPLRGPTYKAQSNLILAGSLVASIALGSGLPRENLK
jgi:hypothetical protein